MQFLLWFGLLIPTVVFSFECYTCNNEITKNGPCIDRKIICENSSSCSMAVMYKDGRSVVRKFCTPPNTPIYQYLLMMPGASMCQNFDSGYGLRHRRHAIPGPPAYPGEQASLLCVCTTPLCNRGTYSKLSERQNIEFDETMAQQMADAGF